MAWLALTPRRRRGRRRRRPARARSATASSLDADEPHLPRRQLARAPAGRHARRGCAALAAEWGERLVGGWPDWIDAPVRGRRRARAALIGARPGEVLVCDSTTVNLFKLAGARSTPRTAARWSPTARNFPTDRYVLEGIAAQRGLALRLFDGEPDAGHAPVRAGRRRRPLATSTTAAARCADLRGAHRRARARARRDADLGPQPLGRRGPGRPARGRRRARRRLHLQVPQRRPGRARLPLRRASELQARLRSPI